MNISLIESVPVCPHLETSGEIALNLKNKKIIQAFQNILKDNGIIIKDPVLKIEEKKITKTI